MLVEGMLYKGACIISVPKTGTMFLTRSLERLHQSKCIFGLFPTSAQCIADKIKSVPHDTVKDVLAPHSPSLETIARRYSQMVSRNRNDDRNGVARIYSDHGMDCFPRFLFNPQFSEFPTSNVKCNIRPSSQ